MNPFSLQSKVALVTGGAVNIGRGIVGGLAQAGAKVAIGYQSHAEEAVALAESLGDNAMAVSLDVGSEASMTSAVAEVLEHFGQLDILVNNAGIFSLSPQRELPAEEWDRIFRVNIRGLFLMTKAATPALAQAESGSVINIASINGFHPGFGNTAHYDASKGAVVAYTRSLAAELAPEKIRVNGIAPGLVEAPWLRSEYAELATMVEERTPLKKLTTKEEIAYLAVFLASPASQQVTGQTVIIDGGYLLT